MALITLSETPAPPVAVSDTTKLVANTATGFIAIEFSSLERVTGPGDAPQNFDINDLDFSGPLNEQPYQKRRPSRGFLRGRRPYFGLLFPRGYYNR